MQSQKAPISGGVPLARATLSVTDNHVHSKPLEILTHLQVCSKAVLSATDHSLLQVMTSLNRSRIGYSTPSAYLSSSLAETA